MFSIGLIYVECSRHEIGIKKFFDNVQKPFDITVNPSDSGQCHRLDFFRFGARTNIFECKLIKFIVNTGSLLEQMRWVEPHPSILGNGCMHPSIFRVATSIRGHREGGPTGFSKKSKTLFFRDIEKPFQEVTPIGPEPHQFFSF